jgi:hypothetical protein
MEVTLMGSYKRPRVFDPLDLEVIDLVYEAALTQIAARNPLSDPSKDLERQEALKKLVFVLAKPGVLEFDDLLDKVLEQAPAALPRLVQPPMRPAEDDSGEHPV